MIAPDWICALSLSRGCRMNLSSCMVMQYRRAVANATWVGVIGLHTNAAFGIHATAWPGRSRTVVVQKHLGRGVM
jgi:hypothetical protein